MRIWVVPLLLSHVLTIPIFAADAKPSKGQSAWQFLATEAFDYPLGGLRGANRGLGWKGPWRTSRVAPPMVFAESTSTTGTPQTKRAIQIQGTGTRNNPLRRELATPYSQKELFIRLELKYRGKTKESGAVDPEFFVLWLDRLEGSDQATHASNVPNIGVHIADRGPNKGKNVFMVRIGPAHTSWSKIPLEKNRPYQLVARLMKSGMGFRAEYDRLDLWVDPKPGDLPKPDATVQGVASMSLVKWVGFSTGLKTEPTDAIQVGQLVLGKSWDSVAGNSATFANPQKSLPNRVTWNQPVDFKRDVYPLLKSRCFECHSGNNPDSGYRLDVHREYLGYSTGEVLAEPGRSFDSRLIEVITAAKESDRMPPDGADPLSEKQVALLRAWVDQGMKWDDKLLPPPPRESDHWAFQSVTRPKVPKVKHTDWVQTPVDAFIAHAHETAGLTHAPEASRRTLIRRLFLDLIGLPPTPKELDDFLKDTSPTAYEDLVDRLLNSPHYGERWGRYWLDLARWAESQGYQHDIVRPYAWRYRDYVIESFNKDKPFDRFLKEQLAGDELQPYSDENLIATGFLGAARISGNQEDEAIQRNDVLVDIVNATGSVFLGLTLECAQCHNHKFDPISQRDYYRLQGFFVKGQLGNVSLRNPETPNPQDMQNWIPEGAYKFYQGEVKKLVRKKQFQPTSIPHAWGFHSPASSDSKIQRLPVVNRKPLSWQPSLLQLTDARLLVRGEASQVGPPVGVGWPEVLGTTPTDLGANSRTQLAGWMTDPKNPLVSRVWVNRLWQYHFGRGLVASASDFGVKGAEPTHPELLDWLASELMAHGWSTKHIHRQIVLSRTYRQQRKSNAANHQIDPTNKLLWCWPRRRLEAEAIRDAVLVASGELDRAYRGVSVPPERQEQQLRRTIYLFQHRSDMPQVMEMFDGPNGIASCSRRAVSTVALQPLYLLNSDFMVKRATALAEIVRKRAGDDLQKQIQVAFLRTLSRKPETEELLMAKRLLQPEGTTPETTEKDGLVHLCHALLNLNEFVYIP